MRVCVFLYRPHMVLLLGSVYEVLVRVRWDESGRVYMQAVDGGSTSTAPVLSPYLRLFEVKQGARTSKFPLSIYSKLIISM